MAEQPAPMDDGALSLVLQVGAGMHCNPQPPPTNPQQLSQYDEINDEVRRARREVHHLTQQCEAHAQRLQEVG